MKYIPGLMVGQLSGKAGNTVASRNRNGSFMRTRVNPTLVRNYFTTSVRDLFTGLSQAFRELSASQIAGWNNLGDQLSRNNSLGASYRMTGLQAFKSLNQVNLNYGNTIVNDAPQIEAAYDSSGCFVSREQDYAVVSTTVTTGAASATQTVGTTAGVIAGDLFTDTDEDISATVLEVISGTVVLLDAILTTVTADAVNFTRPERLTIHNGGGTIPDGHKVTLFLTSPLSFGVNRPGQSAFRYLTLFTEATTLPFDITDAYQQRFGTIAPGTNIFTRFKSITPSGFQGTPIEDKTHQG